MSQSDSSSVQQSTGRYVKPERLRLLIVDDQIEDAELVVRELKRTGFDAEWQRVETECDYVAALGSSPDIVLADYSMPQFSAPRALEILKALGLDIPFIVISGSISEETAVEIVRSGASDYLLKDRLARAGSAVDRVLRERSLRRATQDAERRLREAEERTRFALDAARVGVWETDLTTGAATWSPTLEALHGRPAGSFGGSFAAFLEIVHPEDRRQVADTIERATRDRADSNVVYRCQWPDGTLHWLGSIGRSFYAVDGRPLRAAGIGFDITDRRTLEDQYRQAHKMEAVGQLAGGVAHDFNNLLTVIDGFCVLLGEKAGPDHAFQMELGQIRRAADRATALTRQLLAFSRQQILEVVVFDLREAIVGMETMLRRLIGEHISIRVTTSGTASRVKADRTQIEQVILNLAINARDAMPSGGELHFEITRAKLDRAYANQRPGVTPGDYVLLTVTDTGNGMDAETQARLFEPFFTTKVKGKGTGLGLSTVYGIVKQSGGNIWVSSEVGHGATFKVYLPLVDSPVERVDAPRAVDSSGGSATILVVEDDDAVRVFVDAVLTSRGFRVLLAPRPTAALRIAESEAGAIDLLLSDVMLPEMSGKALADQLTARMPNLRVLYMSGYTDDAIVDRGVLQRGTQLLAKPFTPAALLSKVREVLQ